MTGRLVDDSAGRGKALKQDDLYFTGTGDYTRRPGHKHLEIVLAGKEDFHPTSWT